MRPGLPAQTQGWFLPPETIDLFQQAETRHAAGFHADETLDEQFRVFWEAWDLVDDDFYGDLPAQRTNHGAIKGWSPAWAMSTPWF